MTISQNVNRKLEEKTQVVDLLDNIIEILSISKGELAEKMSYDRATFSRIYNGKEPASRPFLLIARLMLENCRLKARVDMIEAAMRLLGLSPQTQYSEHIPAPLVLNEGSNSASESTEPEHPIVKILREDSRRHLARKARRKRKPQTAP